MKSGLLRCCLLCPILLGWGAAGFPSGLIGQFPGSHRAPWNSPVASSEAVQVSGASIQIDVGPGNLDVKQEDVVRWVEAAASAVSIYYGKFPVARARVLVLPIADEREC